MLLWLTLVREAEELPEEDSRHGKVAILDVGDEQIGLLPLSVRGDMPHGFD
jgi:hypothetical protein